MKNTDKRKLTYFTSDLHIGHAKVIEYSNRPFRDLEHMHRVLINNFNNTVSPDSITYFLGDVGFHKGDLIKQIVSQLNGTKVLILGNHDGGINAMYAAGFDVVTYGVELVIASQKVTLTHCPLKGVYREDTSQMKGCLPGDNWHGEKKQDKFTTTDRGQFHLYGHIHSPNGGKSVRTLGRQFDVGVDANNYTPVSIAVIESWIANSIKLTTKVG